FNHFVRNLSNFICYFVISATHKPLDGGYGILRVCDRLPFGRVTYEPVTAFSESHHGWRGIMAFGIRDNDGVVSFHNGDAGIRSSQVNSNYFSHYLFVSFLLKLV